MANAERNNSEEFTVTMKFAKELNFNTFQTYEKTGYKIDQANIQAVDVILRQAATARLEFVT